MRNNLDELPVLLVCIRAGVAAGCAAYLLLLPRALDYKLRRGKRAGLWRTLLFFIADLALCLVCGGIFAHSLVYANGGEIRLYAAAGFLLPLALTIKLLKTLFGV